MPQPVLLDTDIGSNVDDLLALLLTATAPELDLVGVSTVYGDTRLRARVVRRVLELLRITDIQVAPGAHDPLSGEPVFWTGHEGTGYGDLPETPAEPPTAHELFVELLDHYGEDLVVVAIGPLTNVSAFAEIVRERGQRFGGLVVMGGQFGSGEPDRNVRSDVIAAQHVARDFAALGVPMRFVGIDICRQVWMTAEHLDQITPDPQSELQAMVRAQIGTWWQYLGRRASNPCDPLTVLSLLEPEIFVVTDGSIDFVTSGPDTGSTLWRERRVDSRRRHQSLTDQTVEGVVCTAVRQVDESAASASIVRRLTAALS